MDTLIMLAAAVLPAVLLFLYIWRKDTHPEPFGQMLKALFFGALIAIPVSFTEGVVQTFLFGPGGEASNLLEFIWDAFFVAAVPEEAFKLLVLWLFLRKNPYFDEHFDGIVYAVCVGLGFASVENISYLFSYADDWETVAISRALLSVPGHYAFAVLMGYYYSRYRFGGHSASDIASMFCIPVIAHGIYDSIVFSMQLDSYIVTFCFIALIVFCVKMHKNALRKIKEQIARDEVEPD